ncbi:MAG: hypothetical protein DMF82_03145 [Acidobacteria bacterium]|nr:MAG: hypothetical protein DMF82_03145 [Acidobacteriota bacterium]
MMGTWSVGRGLENNSRLLKGFILSRTPKRATSRRGSARFRAWTAAHSTNVLLTRRVPLPDRNTSRMKARTTSSEWRRAPAGGSMSRARA